MSDHDAESLASVVSDDSWNDDVQVDPDDEHCVEVLPGKSQRLGWFTIMCLILNRTIGTGIFVTPAKIIIATGNVGPALVLWIIGGIVSLAGLHVWNELGLTIPRHNGRSVPRSGGEKNYFEFMVSRPRFLVTCMYGIVYLILGNLTGNAVQLGIYVMNMAGNDNPDKGPVLAIAVAALTLAVGVHIFSRNVGILMNNAFAVFKVSLIAFIILLGILRKAGVDMGGGKKQNNNFDKPFEKTSTNFSSYMDSLIYILYSYSGFKQPFYTLSEARMPRHTFPWATNAAVLLQWTLFVLTNVVFIWAVDLSVVKETIEPGYNGSKDMAALFFESVFGKESTTPKRAMCGLLALSIMGNLIVMTFIAARVKQEIAKEGILPFSLFFAKSSPSIWARWTASRSRTTHRRIKQRRSFSNSSPSPSPSPPTTGTAARTTAIANPEQTPITALLLHLFSSLVLLAVTSPFSLTTSYNFLISLYSYVINALVGFLASFGLLYLKFLPAGQWRDFAMFRDTWHGKTRWISTLPALAYMLYCGVLLVGNFVPPTATGPTTGATSGDGTGDNSGTGSSGSGTSATAIPWYIVPTVGMSSLLWGLLWYAGLKAEERRRGERLVNDRDPTVRVFHSRDGKREESIMTSEIITRRWMTRGFRGEWGGEHGEEREMDGMGPGQ